MRVRVLVSEAWRSLGANLSTTVAATMTVLVGMFLLGLFIALGTWTVSWSDSVKKELVVKVYFDGPSPTKADENTVAVLLSDNPMVKSKSFVTKDQAFKIETKREPALTKNLALNPFPDAWVVTPKNAEDVPALYQTLRKLTRHPALSGVKTVSDGQALSNRILHVAHVIWIVFIVATLVLLIASTLLIANTIRLSIFSRRREIEVMKLVGATNWFVRGPFMLEGLLCGLGGAALAVFFLILGKVFALPAILSNAPTSEPGVHALAFPLIAVILMGMGLGLGALGSGVTMHRFLKV